MKFFIDTADVGEIREAHSLGILDGVTTNPSLIAKSGRKFREVIEEICEIVPGPVSAEVVADSAEAFIKEGREMAKIADNVVIKVPLTLDGLKACKVLSDDGIGVNVTLCFQPMQAVLAAKAGARFISPFIGRLDDVSSDGMRLISEIVTIYDNYMFETEVLAASIRHPMHAVQSALAGAHVATIPLNVINQLIAHPLTEIGNAKFIEDFKKIPQ